MNTSEFQIKEIIKEVKHNHNNRRLNQLMENLLVQVDELIEFYNAELDAAHAKFDMLKEDYKQLQRESMEKD